MAERLRAVVVGPGHVGLVGSGAGRERAHAEALGISVSSRLDEGPAGEHVVLEKRLVMDAVEGKRLLRLAEASDG
ncbi:MAG: hypothetical protein IT337_17165 [Thermomicrobiales bacterium]|nr:hypothetical protein [Thermomicrobiales bacterium]